MAFKKSEHLNVDIKNGKLVITMGTKLLCFAVGSVISDYKITNEEAFANDILQELLAEEDDGTTLVHKMLDKAADNAIENGSVNVEEIKEQT